MIKLNIFNKWLDYHYKLDNKVLSNMHIANAINSLFESFVDISLPAGQETYISIQFKIKLLNNQYRSVSYLQNVKLTEREDLIEIFNEFWNLRNQDYLSLNPSYIIFTYKLNDSTKGIVQKTKLNRNILSIEDTKNTLNFKGYNLPSTMDFTQWGRVIFMNNFYAEVQKINSNSVYHIEISDRELKVCLKNKKYSLFEFTDRIIENGKLNSFRRIIRNQEYIFIDGKCVLKQIKKETKFLKPLIANSFMSSHFITMDLETRAIDGIMIPYAISIYDGASTNSFYLEDYKNSDTMLKSAIEYIMKPRYNNYKIYIHNFSFFDGVFLLKILSDLTHINIKPIIRDGRIIDLKFSFYLYDNKNMINLYFRDSYLLLPSSLAKLARNFGVENKGIFPYEFVNNKDISLNYRGPVPAREFYPDLTIEEYNTIIDSTSPTATAKWDLRKETIKYCEQDVKTLYQIIAKFNEQIFMLFRIDTLKYPTLPSLAFAIYRTHFLKDHKIPLIDGELFTQFKKGYTGGAVDVYKPFSDSENKDKIYRYDVNSLYPYVMREYAMPVGKPIYFEGDISMIEDGSGYNLMSKPFGFFEVEVTAPSNMNIPLLQTRIKTKGGTRTIAPLGTWTGMYFSEEIYNAMTHGYKFKVLRGYLLDKSYIFKEYVDFLYELKVNSDKGTPDYIIAKLLLNTLYGRFGMNPNCENHIIINSKDFLEFQSKNIITNVVDLQNGRELISFFEENEWSEAESKKSLNISVVISSAVTASARIHMSQFKTMKDITLYYTDTDSIDIDKPLPDKFIGRELGLMKLEHIFEEAVFLAPKVYGGRTNTYELVKVKGLKNPISFSELKSLLYKDKRIEINQEKWYRDISQGNIQIHPEIYTLMINNWKRKLIYDGMDKFINTSPIVLNNGKID